MDKFKFPDEVDMTEPLDNFNVEVEVEDDTPEEDRNRQPMPKHIVDELEEDELDSYDEKAQQRLKQLRKVWHDERREKEAAQREHKEAIALAQRLLQENQRVNNVIYNGEREYVSTIQELAKREVEQAKKQYKEAFESGDSEALVDAQEQLNLANLKMVRAHNVQTGALQTPENEVKQVQERLNRPVQVEQEIPKPDRKALAWQDRNSWFGQDEEMTAAALGLHAKLVKEGIDQTSDEYYDTLDRTMRKRFSDYFGEEQKSKGKPSSIVAPASRSTSPTKIRLTHTQVTLAKKLGLTPEQYAKAALQLETRNGR